MSQVQKQILFHPHTSPWASSYLFGEILPAQRNLSLRKTDRALVPRSRGEILPPTHLKGLNFTALWAVAILSFAYRKTRCHRISSSGLKWKLLFDTRALRCGRTVEVDSLPCPALCSLEITGTYLMGASRRQLAWAARFPDVHSNIALGT